MRHIKLFLESTQNPYKSINVDTYTSAIERRVKFSKNEISLLSKLLYNLRIWGVGSFKFKNESPLIYLSISVSEDSNLTVYKDDDEWFYVEHKVYRNRSDADNKYYKCDSLEGLIDLLYDKDAIMRKTKDNFIQRIFKKFKK